MKGSFGTGPVGSQHEMCIRCYKPETTSVMIVQGDIDWLCVMLNQFAGLPMDEAKATAEEIYSDHAATPHNRNQTLIRLCQDCANKTGVPVHNIDKIEAGMELAACIQPDDL